MAVEKDSKIKAAEVNSKNKGKVTYTEEGKADKTIGNDDKDWPIDGLHFQKTSSLATDGAGAIMFRLRNSSQYKIRFYDSINHDDEIFKWYGHRDDPDLNSPQWETELFYQSDDWWHSIHLPKDTEIFCEVQYRDEVLESRPAKWYVECRQGQTDIQAGDLIRVWDTEWKELLVKGDTLITADLADLGKLGAE